MPGHYGSKGASKAASKSKTTSTAKKPGKGSKEMKDKMAKLRAMKKNK